MATTVDRFRCDECACLTKVDEDGCCVMCGTEARVVTIDEADCPFTKARERREVAADDERKRRREERDDATRARGG